VLLPPLVGEGGDGGEKLGCSAPLRRTPTPPSPVEGEGAAPRLTTTFVPNSIGGRWGWGEDARLPPPPEPSPIKGEERCLRAMCMIYLPLSGSLPEGALPKKSILRLISCRLNALNLAILLSILTLWAKLPEGEVD
jgi:hypothetical protein